MSVSQPPPSTSYTLFEQNPILWGKFYFPHHFRDRSPYFHWIMIKESNDNAFSAFEAPRGSAKSTVLGFLKRSHSIAFKKRRFIVIIQNTYKKAVGTLEGIKDEFKYNEKLKNDFGVELEKDAEGDTIFRHRDGFRTRVLCKGVEQIGSIRGERFGAYRPDDIFGDDMEDDEMVKSSERRQSLKDLYDNALIPAGDIKNLNVDIIGTILHDDSLMADLVSPERYTNYRKLFFKARFENKVTGVKESLWPERWTIDELNEMERLKPETFAKEMQGDPSSGSLETIHRDDFRQWSIIENQVVLYDESGGVQSRWGLRECRAAIGIDLAWEEKKANDFAAIVPGLITPANELLVDTYIFKKGLRPDEFENIIFDMNARYEAMTGKRVCFGFEKAMLEKLMKWFLKEAMKRRGKFLWFKDIAWGTTDKVARIMFRMANRYSQHSVFHRLGMGDLENQLIRLRSVAHDDLCLVGDTLIKTNKGNIKLENIKVGDLVLTRNGYQKVINKIYSGEKKVVKWGNLIGTPNHPVITTEGIKRLDSLHVCDILYIWNERLLSIEEKSTIGYLLQREDNTQSIFGDMINGKLHPYLYIDKYTQIISEKYLRVLSFIIKMKTLLITNLQIWFLCRNLNICDSIQVSHIESKELRKLLVEHYIQKNVNKEQEIGIKVQKDTHGMLTMQSHIHLSARKVYNLTIENNNEYFANNILVHNCDAVSMLPEMLSYAPTREKEKPKEDVFRFLQKQTAMYRGNTLRTSQYMFGQKRKDSVVPAKVGLVAHGNGIGLS